MENTNLTTTETLQHFYNKYPWYQQGIATFTKPDPMLLCHNVKALERYAVIWFCCYNAVTSYYVWADKTHKTQVTESVYKSILQTTDVSIECGTLITCRYATPCFVKYTKS